MDASVGLLDQKGGLKSRKKGWVLESHSISESGLTWNLKGVIADWIRIIQALSCHL